MSQPDERRVSVTRAAILAAAVGGIFALGASPALATHVDCGDPITQDTTLDSDLTNCPGSGVVIAADDVELDLNGHTIDGDGVPGGFGVDNSAGHDRVEIEDGEVQEFGSGVLLFLATENVVEEVTAHDNPVAGIELGASGGNTIERNTTFENGFGIAVGNSDGNEVERNKALDNTTGIHLFSFADENHVERNTTSDNANSGITITGDSLRNHVERNTASDNDFIGIEVFLDSNDNVVERNTATGNGIGSPPGTRVGIAIHGGSGTRVERNVTSGNADDGILVGSGTAATLLLRNTANQNLDDGIDVDAPATTVTRNTARNNFDLGIEGVFGMTDGGGNRASGNGNPAQCTFVSCSP